jgi:gliding motility-associatede transport system auxiliary component
VKRIFGLLGWLGVVLVLAAVAIKFTQPAFLKPDWQLWSRWLAIAGLVVTGLFLVSQWRDIGRSFQGRNVRYGSMAIGSVLALLGVLVAVNYIGARQNKRWDLTGGSQFSMSDQTKQVVSGLKKPVAVTVFYDPDRGSTQYRDLLEEYQYFSKQLTVEYIDPIKDPVKAQQQGIQAVPTIVFASEGRTERTSTATEQGLTNALKKLLEGSAKKIYFVQGHGEHDTDDSQTRTGYAGVAAALKNENFDVAKLTLAQTGKVPDDATTVVIAGPKIDYLPAEVDLVRAFLTKGGKIALFLDPPDKPDAPPLTNLIAFAKEWGIDVGADMVIDTSGLGQLVGANSAAIPIAMPVAGTAITKGFNVMTAFPLTRSVTPIEGGTNGHIAQKVLETSPKSWAETDLKGLFATSKPVEETAKGDKPGPVSIAAAVSAPAPDAAPAATPDAPKPESRLVVVGDSDFLSNQALNISGNRDMGMNIGNWLAQQEDMIAIRPKDPEDRRITLTADQGERIFWLAILIVPALLVGNAVRVWWKRR